MSALAAGAVRWSCGRCGVSVGRIDAAPTELPSSWSQSDGELFCLTCSRARAGEEAIDSAPAATSHEERARIRRRALIEFEIDRTPEAPNRKIALACRTSSATVATVRAGLAPTASEPSGFGHGS